MSLRDCIEYYAEPLPGERAQLYQAVWVEGEQVLELSHPVGSPAPIETVREHEQIVPLPPMGRA